MRTSAILVAVLLSACAEYGPQGPPGPEGPPGPGTATSTSNTTPADSSSASGTASSVALSWKGAWSATTIYLPGDVASSAGSTYVATTSSVGASPPGAQWDLLASQSAPGPTDVYAGSAMLMNNVFTDLFGLNVPGTLQAAAVTGDIHVAVNDGVDAQSAVCSVKFSVLNRAGDIHANWNQVGTCLYVQSAGTLAISFDWNWIGTIGTLQVRANSSLKNPAITAVYKLIETAATPGATIVAF